MVRDVDNVAPKFSAKFFYTTGPKSRQKNEWVAAQSGVKIRQDEVKQLSSIYIKIVVERKKTSRTEMRTITTQGSQKYISQKMIRI